MLISWMRRHIRGRRAVWALMSLAAVLLVVGVPNSKDQISTVDIAPIQIDSGTSARDQVRSKLNTIFGFSGPRLSTSVGASFEADAERCVIRFDRNLVERQFPGIGSELVEGEALDLLNLPKLYRFEGRKLYSTYTVECRKLESLKAIGVKSKFFSIDHDIPNIRIRGVPNDTLYSTEQFNLLNSPEASSESGIDAVQMWDSRNDSSSIVVGIIDSGIDYNHPDLKENLWVNPVEIAGNGVDDDLNGYIDDLFGVDARAHSRRRGDPKDSSFHGTTVASVIGARGNNSLGMTGVSWKAKIMAIKVLDPEKTGGTLSDMINGIEYAVMMRQRWIDEDPNNGGANVRVLNISVGIPGIGCTDSKYATTLQAFRDVLLEANHVGITIVAAAGNNGADVTFGGDIPGSCEAPNLITVAATDPSGKLLCFAENCDKGSNYGGSKVHLAAPGKDILGARPQTAEASLQDEQGGKYEFYDGTSVAAPQVAGVVALMLAENQNQTPASIKELLISSSRGEVALEGLLVSSGVLDGVAALEVSAAAENAWHNATLPEDVNLSTAVTTLDILDTYNTLFHNDTTPCAIPTPTPNFLSRILVDPISNVPPAPPRVDVNNDAKLSIADYQQIRTKFLSVAPAASVITYTTQTATVGASNTFATGAACAAPILVPSDITFPNATFQALAGRMSGSFTWIPQTAGCKVFEFATVNNQIYRYFVSVSGAQCSVPQVWIISPNVGAILSGTATIQVDAVGVNPITQVQLLVDNVVTGTPDTTYPYTFSLSTNGYSNGSHVLTARATDSDSTTTTSSSIPVTISNLDIILPSSVTISSPAANALVRGQITVSASATDNIGVTRIEYYLDSQTSPFSVKNGASSTSDPLNTLTLSDASHTVHAKAFDAAGNSSQASRTFIVDNLAPTGSVTSPTGGTTVTASTVFAMSAADNVGVASVTLLIDGVAKGSDTTSPYTVNADTSSLTNGLHSVTARIRDTIGNEFTSQPVTIETWNVTVTLNGPTDNPILPITQLFMFTASASNTTGLQAYDFKVDTNSWSNQSTVVNWFRVNPAILADGQHSISVRARHRTGLTSPSSTLQFRVQRESVLPIVSITAPANNATVSGTVTVTASASDNAGVEYVTVTVDNVAGSGMHFASPPYSFPLNTTTLTNGAHTIQARASDTSGNIGLSTNLTINVSNLVPDTTPPTVTWSAPAANQLVRGSIILSATASDNVGVTRVEFYNGVNLLGSDTTSPYSITADTNSMANGNVTLKVKSFDAAGNVSTDVLRTIQVDNLAPSSVAVTAPTPGSTVSGTSIFTGTAADNIAIASVTLIIDEIDRQTDTTAPYNFNFDTTTLTGQTHTARIRAVDTAGNQTVSSAVSFNVWNTTISISGVTNNQTVTQSKTIFAALSNASGVQFVKFFVDGAEKGISNFSPYSTTLDTKTLANGARVLAVRAYHSSGLVTPPTTLTINVANETVLPTVSITSPSNGATISATPTITINASDNVALENVYLFIDGQFAQFFSAPPFTYTVPLALTPGAHTIYATARDTSGNQATSTTITVNVPTVDTELPTVAITAPAASAVVSGNAVSITATATDNVGVNRVQFFIDGVALGAADTSAPYNATWNTTTASNGTHTITARAFDAAGNQRDATRSVTVDNAVPTVSITAPAASAILAGASATITATANDNVGVARVEFLINGVSLGSDTSAPYSAIWNISAAANSSHTITARAFDTAGNFQDATRTVTVDNAVPTITITSPAANAFVRGSIGFSATASDNLAVARVEFYVDNALFGTPDTTIPYGVSIVTTTLSNGTHQLKAKAFDNGNNSAEQTITVTVDNQVPSASVTSPTAGAKTRGSITVNANASDNTSIQSVVLLVDGVAAAIPADTIAPYSFSLDTTSYSNAFHMLSVMAIDSAGNTFTSANVSVLVDNVAPLVTLTNPTPGAVLSNSTTLTATASDNDAIASVKFFMDGFLLCTDTTSPYSCGPLDISGLTGSHTAYANVTDLAGNFTSTGIINFSVANGDIVAPSVSLTAPAAGSSVAGFVTASANASDNVGVTRVEFYIDGTPVGTDTLSPYTVTFNSGSLSGINRTLVAKAYDAANNSSTSSRLITIDNTLPTVNFDFIPSIPVRGTIVLGATASDNVGVVRVEFSIGGALFYANDTTPPWSASPNTAGISDGTYTVTATAYDAAGNSRQTSFSMEIDNTPPTATITSPVNGATIIGTSIPVSVNANGGVTRVDFFADGDVSPRFSDTTAPYEFVLPGSNLASETHTFAVNAYDAAGNVGVSNFVTVTLHNNSSAVATEFMSLPQNLVANTSFPSSSAKVTQISSSGALFVGTSRGLAISRDNGTTWDLRTTAHGLADNRIVDLYVDGTSIYVATEDNLSVSTNDGATFSVKPVAPRSTHEFRTICADGGAVFLTSSFQSVRNGRTQSICGGHCSAFYYSYDGGNTLVTRTNESGGFNTINSVACGGGRTYVETYSGPALYANRAAVESNSFSLPTFPAGALRPTFNGAIGNGRYFAGVVEGTTTDSGLYSWTLGSWSGGSYRDTNTTAYPHISVPRIYVDGTTLYYGNGSTISTGLNISNDNGATLSLRTTANGLPSNILYDVAARGSTVIAATPNGLGVSVNGGSSFSTRSNQVPGVVNDIFVETTASGKRLYIAASEGLFISNDGGRTFTLRVPDSGTTETEVDAVLKVGSILYASRNNDLFYSYDEGATWNSRMNITQSNSTISEMVAIGDRLVMATDRGLYIWITTGATVLYHSFSTISYRAIDSLMIDPFGNVYAAVRGHGVAYSSDQGTTFPFIMNTVHGLGNNYPVGLATSATHLYVLTSGGVSGAGVYIAPYTTLTSFVKLTGSGLPTAATANYNDLYIFGSSVYVADDDLGVWVSQDSGATFSKKTTAHGLPSNPARVIAGVGSEVYIGTYGGLARRSNP